ncbi:MAG: hypothetical protein KGY40_08085 [Thioalkalivibrio sp.]|jgi:GMP synthase PP-ATPase subunit|nr:hypothetical protein [Thioalkalivibrio sp.]
MKPLLVASFLALTALAASGVVADERYDHYEALESPDLETAMDNLAEYNTKLRAILDKESLSAGDVAEVHQLTYTLENAVERIANEVDAVAEVLEEVHQASERDDRDTVHARGKAYLSSSNPLLQ